MTVATRPPAATYSPAETYRSATTPLKGARTAESLRATPASCRRASAPARASRAAAHCPSWRSASACEIALLSMSFLVRRHSSLAIRSCVRGEARLGTRFERRGARRAAVELCEERPCGHGRASLDERSNDTPRRSRGDIGLLRRGERTRDEDVSGHLALGGDDGLDMSRRRGSRRDPPFRTAERLQPLTARASPASQGPTRRTTGTLRSETVESIGFFLEYDVGAGGARASQPIPLVPPVITTFLPS